MLPRRHVRDEDDADGQWGLPVITADGASIAKKIELIDQLEKFGTAVARQVARNDRRPGTAQIARSAGVLDVSSGIGSRPRLLADAGTETGVG